MQIVVLGLGNILLGDEGIGVHALNILRARFPHPAVKYYDGGTHGLLLLPFLEEATHLLILDAVRSDGPIGTVVELRDKDLVTAIPSKFSAHDIALPDLLSLLRFKKEGQIETVLLGPLVESFSFSTEVSPEMKDSLSEITVRAEKILQGWLILKEKDLRGIESVGMEQARGEAKCV